MRLGTRFAQLPSPISQRLLPVLRYLNLMRAVEMRHLAPWVRRARDWRVLDVGCGYGFYSLDLARRGARLIGCDLALEALQASHQTAQGLGLDGRAAYMAADGSMLPLPGDTFDLIFCNCVLEHIVDDHQALAEMHRTLRPGGLLYLTVDNAEHDLILGFLEHLPQAAKDRLLRVEVAGAPTVAQGLDDYLADIYDVRRRYRRDVLEKVLKELGFDVFDRRAYITLMGAAHYELFHALRRPDTAKGFGRMLFMTTSLLLYPLAVWSEKRAGKGGHGLAIVARKEMVADE